MRLRRYWVALVFGMAAVWLATLLLLELSTAILEIAAPLLEIGAIAHGQ